VPETRVCASCKTTRLSAYNESALCASCERDVFSAAYVTGADGEHAVPVWVWGTAPVRRMLARLDLGRAFEVFRLAAGLSRADAGAAAGWSAATIGMIENGTRDTIYDLRNLLRMVDAFGVPRAVLLPAILGHPGVFPDRRIALAEAGRNSRPSGDYKPGEIMHIIAGKLRARGLEIAERTCGDDITEFTVTDPGNPGKGTVHVSYDGYVTWEFLTEITGDVTEIVTGLLCGYTSAREPGDSNSGAAENPRPPGGSGAHLVSADSTVRGRAG
jgi:transcriptional regulator with XRE-family HTH domain